MLKQTTIRQISYLSLLFLVSLFVIVPLGGANVDLPAPGTRVSLSSIYSSPSIKGVTFYPNNPLQFDFIIDPGEEDLNSSSVRDVSQKLIKYFLASLTIPDKEMWVNLSPYEKDRIIPAGLGQTVMGADLLAQDYLLKQLTASLMYPEENLGKKFWERIYQRVANQYDIPTETFHKVWIIPDEATVYVDGLNVYLVESRLKVMLEEDYVALSVVRGKAESPLGGLAVENHSGESGEALDLSLASETMREVILPEIEKEINSGETFAPLRQAYQAMVLATWYKQNIKESLLREVYIDQNKVDGVHQSDPQVHQEIYDQYMEALEKGVYHLVKEDVDPLTKEAVPREYFSGGFSFDQAQISEAQEFELTEAQKAQLPDGNEFRVSVRAEPQEDAAMSADLQLLLDRKKVSELTKAEIDRLAQSSDFKVQFAMDEGKMGSGWSWWLYQRDKEIDPDKVTHEVLTFAKAMKIIPKGVTPYIEIKADLSDRYNIKSYLTPEEVYQILKKHRLLTKAVVWSWDFKFLQELRQLTPRLSLGYLPNMDQGLQDILEQQSPVESMKEVLRRLKEVGMGLSLDYRFLLYLDKKFGVAQLLIDAVHDLGEEVSVWSVNFEENKDNIQRLFELGVDVLETDQTKQMHEFHQELRDQGIGEQTVIMAHRNNDAYVLQKMIDEGEKYIEIDLMPTEDRVPILFHDQYLRPKVSLSVPGNELYQEESPWGVNSSSIDYDLGEDPAMVSNPGGIDFNPNHLKLNSNQHAIIFHQPIRFKYLETTPITGLSPVIIHISPLIVDF